MAFRLSSEINEIRDPKLRNRVHAAARLAEQCSGGGYGCGPVAPNSPIGSPHMGAAKHNVGSPKFFMAGNFHELQPVLEPKTFTEDSDDEASQSDDADLSEEDCEDAEALSFPSVRRSMHRQLSSCDDSKVLGADVIAALSTPFANFLLSDRGRRLLLIAKEYRDDIIYKSNLWKGFNPDPAVRAKRLLYNAVTHKWETEPVFLQLGKEVFDHGALRECFKMKQIKGRELRHLDEHLAITHDNDSVSSRWFSKSDRTCWVAKRYLEKSHYHLHKQDVAMQMVAKRYGELFDSERLKRLADTSFPKKWRMAPKPVDFLMSHLVEMADPETNEKTTFSVEAFVYGKFDKYNTNSGLVATDRRTPQAFSHFTFDSSSKRLLCVDVQGVDDLYTDPAVHAPSDFLWCDANLGLRGMALFFWSHRCNDACRLLGLHAFTTYSDCQTIRHIAKEAKLSTVRELVIATLTKSETELDDLRRAMPSSKAPRVKVESCLIWLNAEQWCDLPRIRHPAGYTKPLPKELVEPSIHMELCWLYASGRLNQATGGAKPCPEGAVFHLQQAARGGLVCALLALARLCSDHPHSDFLPTVISSTSFHLCMRLLEEASSAGSADAAASLAKICEQGTYDSPSLGKAAKMYELHAQLALEEQEEEKESPNDSDAASPTSSNCGGEGSGGASWMKYTGISRPTSYFDKFGWENHELVPHTSLGAAAALYEKGGPGLGKNLQRACELYRFASEVACDALQAKLSMKYGEKADALEAELDALEGPQLDATSEDDQFGDELEEESSRMESMVKVLVPAATRRTLEELASNLGMKSHSQVIDHLIVSFRRKPSALQSLQLSRPRKENRRMSWRPQLQSPAATPKASPAMFAHRSPFEEGDGSFSPLSSSPPMCSGTFPSGDVSFSPPQSSGFNPFFPPEASSSWLPGKRLDTFGAVFAAGTSTEMRASKQTFPTSLLAKEVIEEPADGDFGDDFLSAFVDDISTACPAPPEVIVEEAAECNFGEDFLSAFAVDKSEHASPTLPMESTPQMPPQEIFEEEAEGDLGDDFLSAFAEETSVQILPLAKQVRMAQDEIEEDADCDFGDDFLSAFKEENPILIAPPQRDSCEKEDNVKDMQGTLGGDLVETAKSARTPEPAPVDSPRLTKGSMWAKGPPQ